MRMSITPPWERPYWYETSVQLVLRDICKSNDVVFDVGANIGGISTMLSRHVGPKGQIIAFEASPRTLTELHRNLSLTHSCNVQVISAAVAERHGDWLPFYFGDAAVSDSLIALSGREPSAYVPTIALDAMCEATGLEPTVVKMDIEGAEFAALRGFERTLARLLPALVLETDARSVEMHDWLSTRGYRALDLASYAPFEPSVGAAGQLHNVLYLHTDSQRGEGYRSCVVEPWSTIGVKALVVQDDASSSLPLGYLEAGRYVVELNVSDLGLESQDEAEIAVMAYGETLTLHIAAFGHIARSYYRLPIHLDRAAPAYLSVRRIRSSAFGQFFEGVAISKILPAGDKWA